MEAIDKVRDTSTLMREMQYHQGYGRGAGYIAPMVRWYCQRCAGTFWFPGEYDYDEAEADQ